MDESEYSGRMNKEHIENAIRYLQTSGIPFGIFIISGKSYGLIICQLAIDIRYVFIDSHGRTNTGSPNGTNSVALYFNDLDNLVEFLCRDFREIGFDLHPVRLAAAPTTTHNGPALENGERFGKLIYCGGSEKDTNWGGHSHCIALSICVILYVNLHGTRKWSETDLSEIDTNAVLLHSICNETAIEKRQELPLLNILDYIAHAKVTEPHLKVSLVSHDIYPARSCVHFVEFEKVFDFFYRCNDYKFAILTINREDTYAICKSTNGSLLFYDGHGRHSDGRHSGDVTVAIFFRTFRQFVTFLQNENEDMFIFTLEYVTVEIDQSDNRAGSNLVAREINGTFAQDDNRFGVRSRNTQCAANSVVFLAFAFVNKDEWNSSDIDAILVLGDQIYVSSFNKALARGTRLNTYLAAHEVDRNIPVNINRLNRGVINVHCGPNTNKEYSGNFGERGETLITRFFSKYENGILIGGILAVALRKIANEFIIFDPHACTLSDMHRCIGKANIFFFPDIPSLYQFLRLSNFNGESTFTLTPFAMYELRDTGRPRRGSTFVIPAAPIDLSISQAPSVSSIRSLPVRQRDHDVNVSQTPSVTSIRTVPVRRRQPKVDDDRSRAERTRDRKRLQRQYERKQINDENRAEYIKVLNHRWTLYLQKVRRTKTANVFGDKKAYIEFFNSHKGEDSDDETIEAALDTVKQFLDDEHHRQLGLMAKIKNNAMVATHFDAYDNHGEVDESDDVHAVYTLSLMDQVCPHCDALYFIEELNTRKQFRTCCNFGEVHIDLPAQQDRTYPHILRELLRRESPLSPEYLNNSLIYNNLLSFASLATTNLHHMRAVGNLGPVMAAEGIVYHIAEHFQTNNAAMSMPTAQLYYLDSQSAVTERMSRTDAVLNRGLLLQLEVLLRSVNPLTETYRMLREVLDRSHSGPNAARAKYHLEIVKKRDSKAIRQQHGGDFGPVTSNEVAAVYDRLPSAKTANIVVFPVDGPVLSGIALKTTDPNRDAMLYPLLFPHAEQTWTFHIRRRPRPGQPDLPGRVATPSEASSSSDEEPEVNRYIGWQDPIPFRIDNATVGDVFQEGVYSEEEYEEVEVTESESEDGGDERKSRKKRPYLSVREFFCFLLMFRYAFSPLLHSGKLSQQFIIDCYARAQDNHFEFLQTEQGQAQIRTERYGVLMDYLDRKHIFKADIPGKELILMPESVVGSRQYMRARYSDALAVVAKYGKPTYFITMTCNPTWKEIKRDIPPNANPVDYPGIVARVFKAKMKELIHDIYRKHVMGRCLAYVGVVEWQKRSLPHFHLVVFISPEDVPQTEADIDGFVSAEIPDSSTHPRLYQAVTTYMSHHRCDQATEPPYCRIPRKGNFKCPRHPKEGEQEDPDRAKACICFRCSKHFPRQYAAHSELIENSYPIYRRRMDGRKFISGRGDEINNEWIVPYNPYLLLKYDCHINVEITSSLKSIKYLFKYLHKGMDMARVKITVIDNVQIYNEFEHFLDCRYLSAGEAMWKLLAFPVFYESHTVVRLPVHLENDQNVAFQNEGDIPYKLDNADSPLTAYFHLNRSDPAACQYHYNEIPEHYVFDKNTRSWHKRLRRGDLTLGRMYLVDYNKVELYSLRLLLLNVKGATSFEDLRTVSGTLHATFAKAAAALGLIEDDSQHIATLREVVNEEMPYRIRCLFVHMLNFWAPADPATIWEEFKCYMIDDYVHRGFAVTFATNLALRHISNLLARAGKTNTYFGLPEPELEPDELVEANKAPEDSITPDETVAAAEGDRLVELLNDDQRCIFDEIVNGVYSDNTDHKLFFVDGPGGSGKTFLFAALLSYLLGLGKNVLAVAWTGIAASLLRGGRTVHSAFKLPFDLFEGVGCQISNSSEWANMLHGIDVIVWDEISMTPRHALDAVDRFLRQLMGIDLPFGGKIFVCTGDWRQILPVLTNASKAEMIDNIVKRLPLWQHLIKRSLSINVRLADPNDIAFARWLLGAGEGTIADLPGNQYFSSYVKMPSECIEPDSIVDRIYGETFSSNDIDNYSKYAVVTTLNEDVDSLNQYIYSRLTEDVFTERTYLSCDKILDLDPNDDDAYDVSLLNKLNPARMPPHELKLKENSIVMLLCNLNPAKGLCNGTRLIVTRLYTTCVRAKILDGQFAGDEVLVSRSRMNIESNELSCKFQRVQLPLKLAFVMTINKSQGQSFDWVGVYLRKAPFAHGQLYVALSRARSKNKLIIQVLPDSYMGKLVPGSEYSLSRGTSIIAKLFEGSLIYQSLQKTLYFINAEDVCSTSKAAHRIPMKTSYFTNTEDVRKPALDMITMDLLSSIELNNEF